MSNITWGKPKIEFGVTGVLDVVPAVFEVMPTAEEDSAQLTTVKGTAKELFGEGHELVARKSQKSYKQLNATFFIPSGVEAPIADVDGVIEDEYSVRLTPEDDTLEGFVMRKCHVEVEETWSSAKGKILKYTFTSLKPVSGAMIETYTKAVI